MEILIFLNFMCAYDLGHGEEAMEILVFLNFMCAYDLGHGQDPRALLCREERKVRFFMDFIALSGNDSDNDK